MPKRKNLSGDDIDGDLTIPLPIQTFFWRQTRPFIRPKLEKLCEASCVSFERVVVQNILHGCSPSLCEAIQSVSRWKVIQAAFPHVMHACAALVEVCKYGHAEAKFGSCETKLLYILHWIILDAASECEDIESDPNRNTNNPPSVQLHSLSTVQLFVYLFAPLIELMEETDFHTLKLENGLRLWRPLWDFRQPDIPCFATPVKPQRNVLKAQRSLLKVNTNAANIYMGKGTSRDNLNNMAAEVSSRRGSLGDGYQSPQAPLARMSDICPVSTDTASVNVEVLCEHCNNVVPLKNGAEGGSGCNCTHRRESNMSYNFDSKLLAFHRLSSSIDRDYINKRLASAVTSGVKGPTAPDILSASYFDVAVLRCLFCQNWSEEGVHWALRYIQQRLLEICEEVIASDYRDRERSFSLPFPDLNLLTKDNNPAAMLDPSRKKAAAILTPSSTLTRRNGKCMSEGGHSSSHSPRLLSHSPTLPKPSAMFEELRKEPAFKRHRIYFDTARAQTKPGVTLKPGMNSRTINLKSPSKPEDPTAPAVSPTNDSDEVLLERGKSVKFPLSLKNITPFDQEKFKKSIKFSSGSEGGPESSSHESSSSSQPEDPPADVIQKPIITITEHHDHHRPRLCGTEKNHVSSRSQEIVDGNQNSTKSVGLSRSMTDTNIHYRHGEEVSEVSGSSHYITENGHINYHVVLKAVHFISASQHSERVCEVLLNILNCLLDLEIIQNPPKPSTPAPETKAADPVEPEKGPEMKPSPDDKEKEEMKAEAERSLRDDTAHGLAMDSVLNVFRSLGCPHGCGDGLKGSHGDLLRSKGHNCLQRLQKLNPSLFRTYFRDIIQKFPIQESMDFLHAFLGFCVEPSIILQTPSQASMTSGNFRKCSSQEFPQPCGFRNNFGHSISGEGYRGVEGVLIASIYKTFLTKCVEHSRELFGSDNIGLFCDVRQFMAYVKEIHGGTFRRIALSGLLDSLLALKRKQREKKKSMPEKIPMRRSISQTSESGDEKEVPRTSISNVSEDSVSQEGKSRKSIFKKRLKKVLLEKSLNLQTYAAASDSELLEDNKNNNTVSPSTAEDDTISTTSTGGRRRFSKFHLGWKRAAKSDHEDEAMSDPPPLDRRESKSEIQFNRSGIKGKMSFKTASHATITFLSARRRIEGGLKSLGKRMSKRGSIDDWKKNPSSMTDDPETDSLLTKEKQLVDRYLIKSGMLRFSFLLECCSPGSLPDPQLVSAMLELEAPVVARASLLLECAHFIHRCNHGDWPSWMRLNLPSFRHSASALQNRGQPSGYRRTQNLQKAAGRMFYSWAEHLGCMLEYILSKEHSNRLNILSEVRSEAKKRELRCADDDEDFLDEATVNESGSDCPYALKMMACLVLQEITTFLRETFREQKSRSPRRDTQWERNPPARRLSSLVSSPGHSQGSECNMADIPHSASGAAVGSPGANERKISFAVLGDRSDSIHSSTTSIPGADPSTHPHTPAEERKAGRHRLAQGRPKLLKHFRRGSTHNTSFRHNRSFRLMRNEGSIKRIGSIKSRKVSSQSLQSSGQAGYADDEGINDDNESVLSDDGGEEHQEPDDSTLCHNMPWVRVVVQLANLSNFVCYHQNYCHPNCYERQRRSCSRLVAAIGKVYAATEEDQESLEKMKQDLKGDFLKERFKRRESIFQQSSPTKRRESTPLLEKIKTDVSMSKLKMTTTWKKEEKPKELKEEPAILKYINSQVQKLTQCPMGILVKAAPILTEDNLGDILPVAWEVMLETDQELVASAASVFLISAVKIPERVQSLIVKELQHEETCQRINAVLRFGVLWKFRHQVWPRMEEGASSFFKLPPPNIDFTLPSPCIGLPAQTVVDPPWTPHFKAKIEVVTANQEETKSLVTATSTRRKEQQEMIRKALQAEEERKRVGRENFLMTTVSVPQLAAYEPSLHHAGDEHEEANVLTEELSLAARRVSLAPTNRANMQGRSPSWRNGSVHWGKYGFEGEEERTEHAHHVQVAQSFFPSCICATVLPILHLLDDHDVNVDGISVAEVAEKVIWQSIVDEPSLFLRYFLEKLTHKDKQEELLFMLRKMIMYYRQLPAQFAHSLFNYLIGYIMFYVRSPSYGSQDAIAGALLLMWQVIPSVEGIYFKDLKQTLKKEQCDPYILISANFPSAKKIIVHGTDQTGIPSQMPIHEDTQFEQILQESLDFFGVPENEYPSYFLVDTKSNQIHNLNSYVRDFYFFRRNFYPELSLVHMNPDHAFASLEKQAFSLKFVEIGKVLFTMAVLQSTPHHQIQNHVGFLHEEFLKLPAFPRKALEAEFGLYHGNGGNELHGLDTLHKLSWVKLMATLFYSMSDTFAWNTDLRLFLNVVNGCVILHCEDSSLLRFCLATLINTCKHFKHIFSMNGFMYVMPTLLKVYSNNQPNPMICQAIEFCCKQFYILHRKPFVLQMFGSITSLLDVGSEESGIIDCRKIQQQCVFQMLISLERDVPDNLSILELVHGEKPLLALDFCYENEPDRLEMIDVVNMCVTVIAYAPDSFRTLQMLNILEMVMPRYLEHLQIETTKRDNSAAARSEIFIISSLGTSMRALISSCEYFTRNMSVPQRQLENDAPSLKGVHSNHSPLGGTSYYDDREDSHASCRHMEEGRKRQYNQDSEDMEMRTEFRRPRDSLLCVIADFYATCKERLKELRKILQDPSFRPPELLDHKSHNRLAEIAHTLMKLAPYDPDTQTCMGLQRYMTEILPMTDWRQEAIRPGLNLILRRLDRFFNKISRKSGLRRRADWDAAANLLKGVYLTLKKFSYITHLPHLKTLICAVLSILLSGPGGSIMPDNLLSIHSSHRNEHINTSIHTPPTFCSAVIKLVAIQMAVLKDQFLLEEICGGVSSFTSHEKCINILVNLILPLSIHLGCGRRDTPKMNTMDVKFSLQVILHVLFPQASPITPGNNTKLMPGQPSANDHHHHRLSCGSASDKGFVHENEMLLKAAYLGLEILMMCYDKVLAGDWHKVTTAIQVLGAKVKVSLQLWKFLDFVVTHRPSIFLLLQPFIQHKMMKVNCDTAQEYYLQQTIKDKLLGYSFAHPKCQGSILLQLASELQCLKDEFHSDGIIMDERSDFPMSADQRRHASITDISVEVINPPPRPSLATIGKKASRATIFSQSSGSTGAAPFKATVLTSSMDSNSSPVLNERKDSRRISARDGHRILEKYRRPTIDDMTSSVDIIRNFSGLSLPKNTLDMNVPFDAATVAEEGPGLQRQPTIVFRGPALTKQSSIDEKFPAGILYENEETSAPMDGRGSLLAEGHTDSPDLDPRAHRLQRLNEKSRKTFKRKSKMKAASIRRYPNRHHDDVSDGERASAESSPTHDPHGSPPRYRRGSPTGSARSSGRWDHTSHHRGYSFHHQSRAEHEMRHLQQVRKAFNAGNKDPQGIARSVETIPESMEMKPSRPRYIQRSRSHDDPYGDYQASSGTARGRIARQGAKIVKSRSPSTSPIRVGTSPTASPTRGQAYVTQYDSNESLDEYSALLKDEVKVHKASDTSRLCYDEQDLSDTLV